MAEVQSTVTYRDVPGFPGYRVGDDGSVWTCWEYHHTLGIRGGQRILGLGWVLKKPRANRLGYLSLTLHRLGKAKTFRVNRLVLEAFVGPCPAGMISCHNNGVPSDNRRVNLRWDTHKANSQDTIAHGRSTRGERNSHHKVTAADVVKIRAEHGEGGISYSALGRRYGLTAASMRKLVLGLNWGHIAIRGDDGSR